jgi:Effector-associated domain 11
MVTFAKNARELISEERLREAFDLIRKSLNQDETLNTLYGDTFVLLHSSYKSLKSIGIRGTSSQSDEIIEHNKLKQRLLSFLGEIDNDNPMAGEPFSFTPHDNSSKPWVRYAMVAAAILVAIVVVVFVYIIPKIQEKEGIETTPQGEHPSDPIDTTQTPTTAMWPQFTPIEKVSDPSGIKQGTAAQKPNPKPVDKGGKFQPPLEASEVTYSDTIKSQSKTVEPIPAQLVLLLDRDDRKKVVYINGFETNPKKISTTGKKFSLTLNQTYTIRLEGCKNVSDITMDAIYKQTYYICVH